MSKPIRLFLSVTMIFLVCACSHNIRPELDQSIEKYNDLLSKNEFIVASMFADDSIKKQFTERVEAASGDIRIFDYDILNTSYDEAAKKATVIVDIEYYLISSRRAKKIRDVQQWAYIEKKEGGEWHLMTPLPEFK